MSRARTTVAAAEPAVEEPVVDDVAPVAEPVDEPAVEEHTNFAPYPESTIGDGYPIGVFMGHDVEECDVGDLGTFVVDPATGCISGPKRTKR